MHRIHNPNQGNNQGNNQNGGGGTPQNFSGEYSKTKINPIIILSSCLGKYTKSFP